jgi:hypothetical protein
MCCGPIVGYAICIKGVDTVTLDRNPGVTWNYEDSLSFYRGHGFSCSDYGAGPYVGNTDVICGSLKIKQAERPGFGCTGPTNSSIYCD